MRKYLLAAVAATAIASPAAARDGSGYFGVEGGILFPKDQGIDNFTDYTTVTTPTGVAGTPGVPLDIETLDAFELQYKNGLDIDLIGGYDFGIIRAELELGWKRAKLDEVDVNDTYLANLNTALNRPSVAPDPGAPGLPALQDSDFDLGGKVTVLSAMANALVDFGNEDGLSFYAGGGFGRARVKFSGESDSKWAWQLIAGARYAISSNIDLGLKYRYFRTGKVDLTDDTGFTVNGNTNRTIIGTTAPVTVDQTTTALLRPDFNNRFRSHSLLASLIFNFGAPPAPPPPPPATQTCPDGSVILATDACPVPPPPPPPPPPEPERG